MKYWIRAAALALAALTAQAGETPPQLPGKFVWADLVTDDGKAARAFYGHVFGWSFQGDGDYAVVLNGGQAIAGLRVQPRPADAKTKPRWLSYVSAADLAAAEQAIQAAGGKVLLTAQSQTGLGRFSICADAESAPFGVLIRDEGDPEDYLAEPGDWIWLQLFSRDTAKAIAFYQKLGGYEVVAREHERIADAHLLVRDGYARAAISAIPASHPDVQPMWLPFVRVLDLQTTLKVVEAQGGKVLMAPEASVVDSAVAIIADPTGAPLGLLQWQEDQAPGNAGEQQP